MFKLIPAPTFQSEAKITVPGGSPGVLSIEWRHQGRAQLRKWIDASSGKESAETLAEVIVGWSGVVDADEQPAEYSPQALETLLDAYPAAAGELFARYLQALTESRLGN